MDEGVKKLGAILQRQGYFDWKLKIIQSGGGLCNYEAKEIWLDESHLNPAFLLHEIAHIKYHDHNFRWADHYTKLMEDYLSLNWEEGGLKE